MPLWTKGGALEIEVKEQTDTSFTFNVVRCRYAETYKAMGLGEIGHLLSCNRDGAFCEGYDPKLTLERTQTIMQGASHCDFKTRTRSSTSVESGSSAPASSPRNRREVHPPSTHTREGRLRYRKAVSYEHTAMQRASYCDFKYTG